MRTLPASLSSWRPLLLLVIFLESVLAFPDVMRPTAASYGGGGAEDSCVLSLVIPRDKIKSSCSSDGRMERRLSAAEVKVNIYRQQVAELQGHLAKERQAAHQKLMALEEKLSMMDLLAKYHHDLEKKVQQLESKFQTSGSLTKSAGGRGEGERLATSQDLGGDPAGSHSNMINAIRPMVTSQVQRMFDNFTSELRELVRAQALAYNRIYDVPRNDGVPPNSETSWPYETRTTARAPGGDSVLRELQDLRGGVNRTGESLATRVGDLLGTLGGSDDVTPGGDGVVTLPTETTRSEHSPTFPDTSRHPHSTHPHSTHPHSTDHMISEATVEVRRTEGAASERPTHKRANDNARIQAAAHRGEDEGEDEGEAADTASTAGLPSTDHGGQAPTRPSPETPATEDPETSDNVIQQRPWFWPSLEALLRREISAALTRHMDSVISLVEKQSAELQSVREQQHVADKVLLDKHSMDLRKVEERMDGLHLEMSSFTEAIKALDGRQARLEALGEAIKELKKNVSSLAAAPAAAEVTEAWREVVDEHGKKLTSLERLTQIFQQSLQHYRNETKAAYSELHEQMNRETNYVRTVYADMHHNVSSALARSSEQLNSSLSLRLDSVEERLRRVEDNNVLVQVDVSDLERRLKSKTSKLDGEVRAVQGDLEAVQHVQRGLSSSGSDLAAGQRLLGSRVNATEQVLERLQMELRLSVSPGWVEYNFDYVKIRTQCFGKQYVQRTSYKVGRLVGVVLCNNTRYKILLADSLQETFRNIGDDQGLGEDHCEFVNAPSRNVRVSPPSMSFDKDEGYARENWGQEPRHAHLNVLRPSPTWYECGVAIP